MRHAYNKLYNMIESDCFNPSDRYAPNATSEREDCSGCIEEGVSILVIGMLQMRPLCFYHLQTSIQWFRKK